MILFLFFFILFFYFFFLFVHFFICFFFFFSSRRRHTRCLSDWIQTCALPISRLGFSTAPSSTSRAFSFFARISARLVFPTPIGPSIAMYLCWSMKFNL